jgi:RhoGAP (GTPase activating protein)-like protein
LDIDLLAEDELYDVNAISSMFKAWLRDLPDEVFPKSIQHKVSATVGNLSEQQGAPEILKTELSNLPPFNYYLLFAVTAHITMLLNASKENKMTFHNLCVCFMPALKMEMPCFTWLILDWKNCWQGCATERDFMEREYDFLERRDPETQEGEARPRPVQHFDRYDRFPSPQPQDGLGIGRPPPASQPQQQAEDSSSTLPRPKTNRSNGSSSDTQSTPASPPRPSTSPQADPALPTKAPAEPPSSSSGATGKRDKNHRPQPFTKKSNSSDKSARERRGSEPSAEMPSWRQGNAAESTKVSNSRGKEGKEDDVMATPTDKKGNRYEMPELSPVKPLSPFGSLGGV